MLKELQETTYGSAERQLYVLMYRLCQHNEIDNKAIIIRIEEIMKGTANSIFFSFLLFELIKVSMSIIEFVSLISLLILFSSLFRSCRFG